MTDLIDTTEMYLRTILELEEEQIVPMRARISERIGHSGPTVSQTVARMERDGLVTVQDDRHLELTTTGRQKAISVMRKHRLAERLLADVIGLEWEFVHEEACRWEHVMSETVERKILSILGEPNESPYGNPIPGLDDLGAAPTAAFALGVVNLVELLGGMRSPIRATIRRLAEPLQSDPLTLAEFRTCGLLPGHSATFTWQGNIVIMQAETEAASLELDMKLAAHIFVDRDSVRESSA